MAWKHGRLICVLTSCLMCFGVKLRHVKLIDFGKEWWYGILFGFVQEQSYNYAPNELMV